MRNWKISCVWELNPVLSSSWTKRKDVIGKEAIPMSLSGFRASEHRASGFRASVFGR